MADHIITHPGKSHFDEFCAVSLILGYYKDTEFTVERREPSLDEIENPDVWIVDIGNVFDPSKKNFDHHQDLDLPVSFVLVGEYLGLSENLSKLSFWQFKDHMDRFGPVWVAKSMGVESIAKTFSPLEFFLLEKFERDTENAVPLMREFGASLIQRGIELTDQLNYWQSCEKAIIKNHTVIFGTTDNTKGIEDYIESMDNPASICVTYDNRGEGWKIRRHNDVEGVDFSSLEDHPDIQFAHKGGFIAKTKERLERERLVELISLGIS